MQRNQSKYEAILAQSNKRIMQETGEFQHPQFLLERPCLYLSSVHEINIYIYIINLPPPYSYCCVPQTTSLLFQQFAAVNALKRVPQSVLSQQLWAVEIATWLWIQDPFCSVFSFYFYSLLEQRPGWNGKCWCWSHSRPWLVRGQDEHHMPQNGSWGFLWSSPELYN